MKRLALLLAAAAGCAGSLQAGPVRLDVPVFDGGYGIGFFASAARTFEAAHPGVRVDVYGSPRIQDQVRIRMVAGDYPDLACVPYIRWPALIREDKVVDLRPYLAGRNWENDAVWGDTFQPGSLDSWRVGEGVYGLPFAYSCWSIFYNRGMFATYGWKEPRTWDEFFALCRSAKAHGVVPVSVPGTRWLYPAAFFRAAFHDLAGSRGWTAANALVPGAWADPAVVRSAALLARITSEDVQPGWQGETAPGAELYFLQGKAAMTVSGSWFFNEMGGKIPANFSVGTMNFPVFADGAADPTTIQTGSDCFFVFNTGDAHKRALAIEFLRFLTSRASAASFVRQNDAPVAVRGVPALEYSQRMRETAAMISRAGASFNMPQVDLQPPVLRQALIDGTQALMDGRLAPAAFAGRIEAAASADRAMAADPGHVEMRHPFAGTALLAVVASIAAWLAADGIRTKARLAREAFGKLRPPMAAGFVGPALVVYAVFTLAPAAAAFLWSLFRWDGIGARTWAGLYQFRSVLYGSDALWSALGNNAFLVVVPAACVIPISLLFALLIHRGVWGAGAFRTILLLPNLLGAIAATLIWLTAYQPHSGLVNTVLSGLGQIIGSDWLRSFADYPWLSDRHLYAALIPIYIWMACGFNLVLYLAAMEGIDPQLYEAADIDGAPGWKQFLVITLPLIRGVIAISAVFLVVGGLNAFEMVWLLTSQDPSASVATLGTLLVTTMFKDMDIGRASALAVLLFALVLTAGMAVLRIFRSEAVES